MSFSQNRTGSVERQNENADLHQQFLKAAILDNTEQSFVLIDRDLTILTFNNIAEKRSREILDIELKVGMGILELVKPADTANFRQASKSVLNGEIIKYQRHYDTDGSDKWFSCTLYPMYDDNQDIVGICFSALEITDAKLAEQELKKSMEKYRTAIDFTYDWEFWQDPEGAYIYVSPSCKRITGYSAQDFIDNPSLLYKITHPLDREKLSGHIENENKDPASKNHIDFRIIDRAGNIRWISHYCQAVYDSENNYAGKRVSQRDVTERVNAEQKLRELNKKLTLANEEMQKFVSFTTHDLRSPVVNIKGFVGELNDSIAQLRNILSKSDIDQQSKNLIHELIDKEMSEDISFIDRSAESINVMLTGLKALTRPGMMDMDIKPLDVNKVVQEVVDSMKFEIEKADARVDFGSLPGCMADENMLSQIFSNLISNAVKYRCQQRACIINITGTENNQKAHYRIEDNGIGIDENHFELIFEPFKRLNNSQSIKGDGLGLAIVKRMVERQGGSIKVESVPGDSTAFTLSLKQSQKNIPDA